MSEKPYRTALLLLCMIAPGCARARPSTIPSLPPLDVPAAPPRIILPIEVEVEAEEPPAGPPAEEPRLPPPARPRAAAPADVPRTAEEPPRPTSPAAPPAATLQTTPAAEQGEVERAIRATMARATADLNNRIDYRALNADARLQYETAKRFVQQAEDAIRMKNLPFAKNLADKAAVLAAQLAGQ